MYLTEWDFQLNENPIRSTVLVLGLGNPILGDDGVGWRVVEEFEKRLKYENPLEQSETQKPLKPNPLEIEIDYQSVGGLALMERMVGYDQVILVDAITTGSAQPGTVKMMRLADLPDRTIGHLSSGHDTTLQNALKVGKVMGAKLPESVTIVGIEANQVYNFSDELSFAVQYSIPEAVHKLMELIK
jgi:hydrogenase maturation protease